MKNFNELKSTIQEIGSGKGCKSETIHAMFGVPQLAKCFDVVKLNELATKMLADCKIWIENWTTIQEGLQVELMQIRKEELRTTAENLKGKFSPEELKALMETLNA